MTEKKVPKNDQMELLVGIPKKVRFSFKKESGGVVVLGSRDDGSYCSDLVFFTKEGEVEWCEGVDPDLGFHLDDYDRIVVEEE